MERRNAWLTYDEYDKQALERLCHGYRRFLDEGKTERECVSETIELARDNGYVEIGEAGELHPGDKVYACCMGKTIALFQIGNAPLEEGMNILCAHIDSPRLDIKQNPLYEDSGLALLDTHYYGGIKKYQWVTLPMAIHGVVCMKDGTKVEVIIGEKDTDPVVGISDLLIHLAQDQLDKKARVVIEGEQLDVIVGNRPVSEEKDAVKEGILAILKDTYDMDEEDFYSAELEVVPAGHAREFGLDRSMIMGYGQDDRACAYTSLISMLDCDLPEKTACCLLVDKEEIGSVGATGMESRFFENTVAEVLNACGCYSELSLRRCLANSSMISSDVSAGFDPGFPSAFEKKNTSLLGCGVVFNKFTGHGGKAGSNDANAEYVAQIRQIMDNAGVCWQTSEVGKVDGGGGGTIAFIAALYGMNVIDCGVSVLSMHAPWEITSKADLYEAKKGYDAFLKRV
ncbi:MAG: aminopeptidase [Lachnospiraceae bacterium]|nr:aminopeptidase [Lachnospiraceae bacterium]